jgi:hypothetical protein
MDNIQEFFAAYEQFTASGDASGYDRFFASPFMSASADGVRMLTPEQLAAAAPRMRAMLDKQGRRGVALMGVQEQQLDAHYVMTTSNWQWRFEPEGGAAFDISLAATHILHKSAEGLRIVFYRSGDIVQALRTRGLIS